jgi:acetyl esterase
MTVAIDPEILAARAKQAAESGPFDVTALPTAEGRRLADKAAMAFNDGTPALPRVEDIMIDGPGGPLRLRVFEPESPRGRGAILYIHGGGWFACSVDTHDRMMRLLAIETGVTVIGVDFRLSPEHAYPAALHDCIAAWEWLQEQAQTLGIDPVRVAVAGDSAGANLALALTLDRRDRGLAMPVGGALLYACLAPGLDTESSRTFGQGGYGLTHERMQWYWDNYLGEAKIDPPILATPLHADLRGLPPQFLGIAEADTVADDSRLLLDRLTAAGVEATLTSWPGTVHGFLQMTRDVASAREAVRETAKRLAEWVA